MIVLCSWDYLDVSSQTLFGIGTLISSSCQVSICYQFVTLCATITYYLFCIWRVCVFVFGIIMTISLNTGRAWKATCWNAQGGYIGEGIWVWNGKHHWQVCFSALNITICGRNFMHSRFCTWSVNDSYMFWNPNLTFFHFMSNFWLLKLEHDHAPITQVLGSAHYISRSI